MTSLNSIDNELLEAIHALDFRRIRLAISYGANPNWCDGWGESPIGEAVRQDCYSNAQRRDMVSLLIALGAFPGWPGASFSTLYSASFDKDDAMMELLLTEGANPNAHADDEHENLYDMIEFDYRYDLWDLHLPIEPTDDDKKTETSWLDFLERCAACSNRVPPTQLLLLRKFGALNYAERKERREARAAGGLLQRIVSGGQTGADRAALDWAILEGIEHGGWCPEGRLAEDGRIPNQYQVVELEGGGYRARTRRNVLDSDGTLIVNRGLMEGGTLLTQQFAEKLGKPYLVFQADPGLRVEQSASLANWLGENQIRVLNVAGPRESNKPGIYIETTNILCAWLGRADARSKGRSN